MINMDDTAKTEAKKRLVTWLDNQQASAGKDFARMLVAKYKKDTPAMREEFQQYVKDKNLMRWEMNAISDMIVAYQYKKEVE